MIRTKFPTGTFQLQTQRPIINGVLCCTNYSIDRIQLSVSSKCYFYCLDTLKQSQHKLIRTFKTRNKSIYRFQVGKSTLEIVKYTGEHTAWCQIAIQDPTTATQREVTEIITKALAHVGLSSQHASVTQVEFAMDYKPVHLNQRNLSTLSKWFYQSTTLNHSRLGSVGTDKATSYRGKNGYVRKGAKGIRSYNKETFTRFELQANKDFLRDRIDFTSLPINTKSLNIFDHVKFRQPLTQRRVDKINKSIKKAMPSERQKVISSILRKDVTRLLSHPNPIVQKQIDTVKQVFKRAGVRFVQDQCFPEILPSHFPR